MNVVQITGMAGTGLLLKQLTPLPIGACVLIGIPLFLVVFLGAEVCEKPLSPIQGEVIVVASYPRASSAEADSALGFNLSGLQPDRKEP